MEHLASTTVFARSFVVGAGLILLSVWPAWPAELDPAAEALRPPAPAAVNNSSVPISTLPIQGMHLTAPPVNRGLRLSPPSNRLSSDWPEEQYQTAANRMYADFAKRNSPWISPEVEQRARQREQQVLLRSAPEAIQPVTATVFVLAVDFGGTDKLTLWDASSGYYEKVAKIYTGPLKGGIPHPGPRDNNTIWYEPSQTNDASFYRKLIFGYEGVGRIRMDLTDPEDGQPGINLAGYTLQDYYDHIAGPGNFTIQGEVYGWVTVNHSEAYYGADDYMTGEIDAGGPVPVGRLVVDAVNRFRVAHPNFDWRQYDTDHDGVVDSLWIIHAGVGEEAGGGAQGDNAIWSHSFDLRGYPEWPNGYVVYEGDPGTTSDDIVIGPYTMQPENPGLGVLCEEFGHNFFGLPDLYTNDIPNSVGFWSIMSSGAWGGPLGGAIPVGFPLYFRIIATTTAGPVNWQQPMKTIHFSDPAQTIAIGQLEDTPSKAFKGLQVLLGGKGSPYAQSYLVEWRAPTKYDRSVRTAYITSYYDEDEWEVQRVPYNIPGAVVYFRNPDYHFTYSLSPYWDDGPSLGPKYPLLVVDVNWDACPVNGVELTADQFSYDAALALQPAEEITLSEIYGQAGSCTLPSKPPVTQFNDALGYYQGLYTTNPYNGYTYWRNFGASCVIPAKGRYSTRICYPGGAPAREVYGLGVAGSTMGCGQPGDAFRQYGVVLDLVGKSDSGDTGYVRFRNILAESAAREEWRQYR